MRQVLDHRTLRNIYNGYCAYILRYKKSRSHLVIILNKLDMW
jgi:hypothetical protein